MSDTIVQLLQVRISKKDMKVLAHAAIDLDISRATLVKQILTEWMERRATASAGESEES